MSIVRGNGEWGDYAAQRLVAGEEAGPGASGQHAQVPTRADAAFARPRPAPVGRCKHSIGSARMHGNPAGPRIVHFQLRCTADARSRGQVTLQLDDKPDGTTRHTRPVTFLIEAEAHHLLLKRVQELVQFSL